MESHETLRVSVEGRIATLTLTRPDQLSAASCVGGFARSATSLPR
jgi:enoyl-CoA hydratase/carnithine racemase